MADSEIIRKSDLVELNAIKDALQDPMLRFVDILDDKVQPAIISLAKSLDTTLKSFKFDSASLEEIKKINEATKQANDLTIISEKVTKAKAASAAALQKAQQETIKTTEAQITVDDKKIKSDEKKIVLTDKELAQAQIDKANQRDRITLLKAELIELDKTVGTLQRVEAANTRLRIERKSINTDTAEGKKRLAELNEEINKNNKYITENSDKLKQQKLNVGNYTASIREAFEGTGILGDTINKYLGIITTLSEKIEKLVVSITAQKVATEGSAAATETATAASKANTVAEEKNIVATEGAAAAEKINTASLEAQTVATETATVATEGLGKSLKALATNPYVLIAVGIAALTKVIIDNVNATQAQKDNFDALKEAATANTNTTIAASIGYKKLFDETKRLFLAEKELEDLRASKLESTARLRAEANEAREAALQDGITTAKRIEYLSLYIAKTKEANDEDTAELKKNLEIKQGYVTLYGKFASRKQKEDLEAAKAAVEQDRADDAAATIRGQKQLLALIEKYNDEILKLRQDRQKQEIDLIDTFSKYKAEQLTKQLEKDLLSNTLDTDQAVENLRRKQKELGAIDANGIDHTKEFEKEISTLQNTGAAKAIALRKKTNEEIAKLNEDFQTKQLEAERKFREDLQKLDEAFVKATNDLSKQKQANDAANNQAEIDHQQNEISDLRERRNREITEGKNQRHLTLADLTAYFDTIDTLEREHYERSTSNLKFNSEVQKNDLKEKINDDIQAIKDKYAKIKAEDEKAIANKTTDPVQRKKEIDTHAIELAKKEAEEIEKVQRDLSEQLLIIEEKLNGDLSKADEDELKRQRAILKQKQEINNQEVADKKAANEKLVAAVKKTTDQITAGIAEGLQQRSELQQAADQKDIDFHTRMLDVQAKLAAEGKDNILAEELARADKAEEKKIQDQKKAAEAQKNITIIKTFADTLNEALSKDGTNFLEAFGKATAASGLVSAMFSKLFSGSAFEGTEDTGAPGKLDNKGGMAWILHPHEGVVNAEGKKEVPGLVTAINEGGLTGVKKWVSKNISNEKNKSSEKNVKNIVNEKNILNTSDSVSSSDASSVNITSEKVVRFNETQLTGLVQNLFNESVLNTENVSNEKNRESSKNKIVEIIVNNFKNVFSSDALSTTENTSNLSNQKEFTSENISLIDEVNKMNIELKKEENERIREVENTRSSIIKIIQEVSDGAPRRKITDSIKALAIGDESKTGLIKKIKAIDNAPEEKRTSLIEKLQKYSEQVLQKKELTNLQYIENRKNELTSAIESNTSNFSSSSKENIKNSISETSKQSSDEKNIQNIQNRIDSASNSRHDILDHVSEKESDASVKNVTTETHTGNVANIIDASFSEKEKNTENALQKVSHETVKDAVYNSVSSVAKLISGETSSNKSIDNISNIRNRTSENLVTEISKGSSAFQNIYLPQFQAANISTTQTSSGHDARMTEILRNEIRELKNVIAGKPVSQTKVSLGKLGEWAEEIKQDGMTTIIHHKKNNARRSLRFNG